jgi:hypothetical protein
MNMLTLLVLAALTPVQYQLPTEQSAQYDVRVVFEGFIPVLGGQEGEVQVDFGVAARGLKPDAEGLPRAESEMNAFRVTFNGAPLPFSLANAASFFPKTTISMTPHGRLVKTDAPDVSLPVRLPGLDVRRFPDITYLPIEFPEAGVEVGKSWTFKKSFGDGDVQYEVTPTSVGDETIEMDIRLRQRYEVLEDAGLTVVTERADAVARVTTDLAGEGKASFDRKRGLMRHVEVKAKADSQVVDLARDRKSQRTLTTRLRIQLRG